MPCKNGHIRPSDDIREPAMPGMALISGWGSLAVQKIAIMRSASEVIRGIPVQIATHGPDRYSEARNWSSSEESRFKSFGSQGGKRRWPLRTKYCG
jgi:hypothetical protein